MTSLLDWVTTFNHNRENAQEKLVTFVVYIQKNDIFVVTYLQFFNF